MNILLSTIIKDCGAEVKTTASISFDQIEVKQFIYDTRKVDTANDALFLCLAKNERDILHHVNKAISKGINLFLIPEGIELPDSSAIFLQVPDVIRGLQTIAIQHRKRSSAKIIGITGSNGKTIIKEWLSQILDIQFKVTKSPASFNSQLGVPLSVLLLERETDYGIFEAGISQINEMQFLQPIIDCNIGILTNIGDAHDIGFSGHESKLIEKLALFIDAKKLIFEESPKTQRSFIQQLVSGELISWSIEEKRGDYWVQVDQNDSFSIIHLHGKHKLSAIFYLTDQASIKNVIHVIIACLEIGLHPSYIIDRVRYLEPVSMRLVMKKALRNCLVIDDSYNADLTSLENALHFAKEQKKHRSLHLIVTEFDQIKQDDAYFDRLSDIMLRHHVDKISYIGQTKPVLIQSDKIRYYQSSEDLQKELQSNPPESETILLKGARRFQLDHLISELHAKSHRTELLVNLDAISNNVKAYRAIINAPVKIMAVIKAGAYGSESVALAKHLLRCGVEYLAVAYYDEAVELRKEGIAAPIMIMNPDPSLTYIAEQYDLELEIYDLVQLRKIASSIVHKLKIHIKIDSGMHRLGFVKEEIPGLLDVLSQNKNMEVRSIFSHLSSAEDTAEDSFTQEQFDYFNDVAKELLNSGSDSIDMDQTWLHICNSNAAYRFPGFHLDMIRLGIGLYGYVPMKSLQLAHEFRTYVAQIKTIQKGDSVGYNRSYIAEKERTIATLCIGYADGLSRKAGHGKMHFKIHGISVPTVGNISMDTCSVDVTNVPVKVGDEVIVFDTLESFYNLSELSEKSPYEFLSGIGHRVVRSYIRSV